MARPVVDLKHSGLACTGSQESSSHDGRPPKTRCSTDFSQSWHVGEKTATIQQLGFISHTSFILKMLQPRTDGSGLGT
jgi:hypothetical protein